MNDIAELRDSLHNIEQAEKSSRQAAAEYVYDDNENITVTEDYEIFQQAVNRIVLRNIIDDVTELTEGQQDTISTIANACPYAGGEAVYLARALLNDGAYYHDSLLCVPPSPIIRPAGKIVPLSFKVLPNPGNGYTMVTLSETANEKGEIFLTNALGVEVFRQAVAVGDKNLMLVFDDLPTGMYYLTIRTNTKSTTQLFTNLK